MESRNDCSSILRASSVRSSWARFEAAVRALPVAAVEAAAFVAWADPVRAGVRRTSPIAAMPNVVVVHGIPVAFDPNKLGARANRNDIMPRRRRRPNLDSDGDLGSRVVSAKQEH